MLLFAIKVLLKLRKKLYISQPTISTHIRMLEQEFNSRLIIRTTKNIEITPHGKELFACAQKIFTLKNDLIQKWSEENKKNHSYRCFYHSCRLYIT